MAAPAADPPPPDLDFLAKKWDRNAAWYAESMQRWALTGYQTLWSNLGFEEGHSVLECGCGPADALKQCLPQLPTGVTYVATDYAPEMVKMARETLPGGIRVEQSSADDLAAFGDAAFDRYLANLCLMLVPDFDASVKEAARVLKPGGVAGVTMWGDRDLSPFFTLQPKVLKKLGIATPPTLPASGSRRSNFHVCDRGEQAVRETFLGAGFDRAVLFHGRLGKGHLCGRAFAEEVMHGAPANRQLLEELKPEEGQRLLDGIAEEADALIAQGVPIALDVIYVIARKGP